MTWDVTTPAGSENRILGDDRIRELKTDIPVSYTHLTLPTNREV